MLTIPRYQALTLIYESMSSLIFRGRREEDSLSVVLKVLKDDFPAPIEIVRYRQEFKITSALQGQPGIIRTYGMETYRNTFFIVLEDFGAESLERWLILRRFTLQEKLALSLRMVECLDSVHRSGVIHKDVNPSNFVFNPATDELKIIDFGISTQLTRESPELQGLDVLEGTLLYISPEQTGRMNCAVDFRTDYYSLGVTLYQLLTGVLPFASADPSELVHCHLVRRPQPPNVLRPEVPVILSSLVMKLLAKAPEERYQSALGLKTDLDECLRQLQMQGEILPFELGARDVPERLLVPQRLYGRERDADALSCAFERVAGGGKELTLIAGPSGVGKTALVQELFKPLTLKRGYYSAGKFDLLQRDVPYKALVEAFRQLARHLLCEPEVEIERWRQLILDAVGKNGKILTDLIPEMEHLVGPQPELEELPPTESQNRFNLALQDFLGLFATSAHPLVLFIDDLQWADASSMHLLRLILTTPEIRCLHLLGAYRDCEVAATHPLLSLVEELQEIGVRSSRLTLSPLSPAEVMQLLSETLHGEEHSLAGLAELVLEKTQGNPFFIHVFLDTLSAEGLLTVDPDNGAWSWDLSRIRTLCITDNVAELMVKNLRKLPGETPRVLEMAACVGSHFDLDALAWVCGSTPKSVLALLEPALAAGFVIPLGVAYRAIEHDAPLLRDGLAVRLRFAHDRIQQTAYSLIPEAERAPTHLRIGKLLQQRQSRGQGEGNDFDVVNHLNLARSALSTDAEREELAILNLRAGCRAKASAAYEPALDYLALAHELLGPARFEKRYECALEVCQEAAEAAYLVLDFERMDGFLGEVLAHARTVLDQTKAIQVRIISEVSRNRPMAAVRCGLSFLGKLGVNVPLEPSRARIGWALFKITLSLKWRGIERLVELPPMSDPGKIAAVQIMRSLASAAYMSNPSLYGLLVCEQVELLFAFGHTPWSGSVLGSLGLILCALVSDIETGYRLGKTALCLIDRTRVNKQRCRTLFVVHYFVLHWKDPLRTLKKPLLEAYQAGLQSGDFEYAAYAATGYCQLCHYLGDELGELCDEMERYGSAIGKLRQHIQLGYHQIVLQGIHNLQGRCQDPRLLIGEIIDETELWPRLCETNDRTGLASLTFHRMLLACLFRDYARCLELISLAEEQNILRSSRGLFTETRFCFLDSIARLGVAALAEGRQRKELLAKVAANQRRLRRWARHAPCNHLHVFELVEAERHRLAGRISRAGRGYERAIQAARQNGFPNEEGWANELAGQFFLDQGELVKAQAHLYQARYAYERWGASAKVRDVEERYGEFLPERKAPPVDTPVTVTISRSVNTTDRVTGSLELAPDLVIQAVQGISQEILPAKLMQKAMKILIESASADRGLLFLVSQEEITLEAILDDREQLFQQASLPLTEGEAPSALVRYVLRTGESTVLIDAAENSELGTDPYILRVRPRGILCCPLVHRGEIVGALYLENRHTADVFTPARVKLVGWLATQLATSLENSRRYQERATALEAALSRLRTSNEALARTSRDLRGPLCAVLELPDRVLQKLSTRAAVRCGGCGAVFDFPVEQTRGASLAPQSCPACGEAALSLQETHHAYEGEIEEMEEIQRSIQSSGRELLQIMDSLGDRPGPKTPPS